MEENLTAIVLLVLHWVETEVELCKQVEMLDVLELRHLDNVVEGEVQKAQTLYVMKPRQVPNMVLGEVELLQVGQVAQTRDLTNLILGEVKVLQVQSVQVLDLRDLVHAQRE